MSKALPTMLGSALNWRRHQASVSRMTGRAPLRASSGREGAAHGRLHAEHLKEVGDDVDAGGGDGRAAQIEAEIAGAGEGEVAGHILIGAGVRAELVVGISGVGGAGQAALGGRRRNPDQLLRVGKGQRAQQQRVDDAEDGDVGADAEGENEDGDEGEAAVAAEGAEGVTEILEKNVEFHKSSRFALLVFCQFDAAEANQRLAAGFKGSEAALDVFFDRHLDVRGDLGFEVGVERGLAEERAHAGQRPPQARSLEVLLQGTWRARGPSRRTTAASRRRLSQAAYGRCG